MIVRVVCPDCTGSVRVDTEMARRALKVRLAFGFGRHVTDERAFAMRLLTLDGWLYMGRDLGRSTVSMRCPDHDDEALRLEEDADGPCSCCAIRTGDSCP